MYTVVGDRGLFKLKTLCELSDFPSNPTYLSTGYFLIGEPLNQLPAIDYTNVKINRISRWQTCQQQLQQFWQRWSKDYLQSLKERHGQLNSTPNFQPFDLVLLMEYNTTPLQWPTAFIQHTHHGEDGNVRAFNLKKTMGVFRRPTSKICTLPCVNDK